MSKPLLCGHKTKADRDEAIRALWVLGFSAPTIASIVGKGMTAGLVYSLATSLHWPKKNSGDVRASRAATLLTERQRSAFHCKKAPDPAPREEPKHASPKLFWTVPKSRLMAGR